MKIKKVKWNNHPVLGNLVLDFTNAAGVAFDNIVFAGENGTGKTSILETIGNFLNIGSFEFFEYIEYEVAGNTYTAVPPHNPHVTIRDFYDRLDVNGQRTTLNSNRNNNPDAIAADNLDIRNHGCIFSKARADYKTVNVESIKTSQLDTEKYNKDDDDNFTVLKQLIVDIDSQDNAAYANHGKHNLGNPMDWALFYPNSKTYRFKNSFDTFFGNIQFDRVEDQPGEKRILFTKNGTAIPIDNLSTGEKQVVFRGVYLLKNMNSLGGAIILIDEPELSMHPKWQRKVLQYYKGLFTDAAEQKAQLFFASHSEHVLKTALSDKTSNLVIVLNATANGVITSRQIVSPWILPTISDAETNYLAFDLVSSDFHIALYGYLQYREHLNVKGTDDYILAHHLYNPVIHRRPSPGLGNTTYETLPTLIRNSIDHPNPAITYSEEELRASTRLLIDICS